MIANGLTITLLQLLIHQISNMVFTQAQTTAFFTDPTQMSISAETRAQLQIEGIDTIDDLLEFDTTSINSVVDNLRRPGGRIPNPDVQPPDGSTIPRPPFLMGAKSIMRLEGATKIVKYYETVGRELTAVNMRWNNAIKIFVQHFKALEVTKKENEVPDVPKITKTLAVTKWSESFKDFLSRVLGMRMIPLSYVIRDEAEVPAAAPPLATHAAPANGVYPYSELHGSVEEELIARGSHDHPHFRNDNQQVYNYIEEATRGTIYAASIKPSQRTKDGRKAWNAIVNQYAGKDKWEKELKECDDFIHTRKWTGAQNYTLEKFVSQHRTSYISMCQCAEHVDYQLPNEITRVKYLLEGIENSDPTLQAALALVRADDGPNGKMHDFESATAFLLPSDPVSTKRGGRKRGAHVSFVTADIASSSGKQSKGPVTGVEFRYYELSEYQSLSTEQQDELRAWRIENKGHKKPKGNKFTGKDKIGKTKTNAAAEKKRFKVAVSAAVAAELGKRDKEAATKAGTADAVGKYMLSVMNAAAPASKKASAATASAANALPDNFSSELNAIMERASIHSPKKK